MDAEVAIFEVAFEGLTFSTDGACVANKACNPFPVLIHMTKVLIFLRGPQTFLNVNKKQESKTKDPILMRLDRTTKNTPLLKCAQRFDKQVVVSFHHHLIRHLKGRYVWP